MKLLLVLSMINFLGLVSACTKVVPFLLFFSPLTIPIFLALDASVSIKAYQVYHRIQKENGEEKQASKDKLNKILSAAQAYDHITSHRLREHYHSSNHCHNL